MTVENYLRVRRWEEPIGGGTGLGLAYQRMSDVSGYLWIGMSHRDWLEWLAPYRKTEMSLEDWLIQELRGYDLGITVTALCIDSTPKVIEGEVRFQVSVEDWECQD